MVRHRYRDTARLQRLQAIDVDQGTAEDRDFLNSTPVYSSQNVTAHCLIHAVFVKWLLRFVAWTW